jgi:proline iminopeptidase
VQALTRPDLAVHADYAQAYFPAWFADPAFARNVSAPRGHSETGAHVAARLRREGYDWRDRLRDLPVPTLVVHGAADALPLAEAERTAGLLAQARLLPVPDAGHNPFWEAPDVFFDAVHHFLTEDAPAS